MSVHGVTSRKAAIILTKPAIYSDGLWFRSLGQRSWLRVLVVLVGPFNKCRGGTSF